MTIQLNSVSHAGVDCVAANEELCIAYSHKLYQVDSHGTLAGSDKNLSPEGFLGP